MVIANIQAAIITIDKCRGICLIVKDIDNYRRE
jgi:hypothetical protein